MPTSLEPTEEERARVNNDTDELAVIHKKKKV
jgi:hypothetical protein